MMNGITAQGGGTTAPVNGGDARLAALQGQATAAQQRAAAELDQAQARTDAAQAKLQQAVARKLEAAAQRVEGSADIAPIPPIPPVPVIAGSALPPFAYQPPMPSTGLVLGSLAMLFVALPLAITIARLLWRRANGYVPATASAASPEVINRLARIEQAVESIAIEVERVSEGQRFTTKLLSEGALQPIAVKAPDAAGVPRAT